MFAILFGLSMDYNVFLLSRVHEACNEGDGPRESVIHGVARIGKVILFAGLIMAAVFLAFVTQPDVIGKMMGLGLGLAILIGVLFVRLLIAPRWSRCSATARGRCRAGSTASSRTSRSRGTSSRVWTSLRRRTRPRRRAARRRSPARARRGS